MVAREEVKSGEDLCQNKLPLTRPKTHPCTRWQVWDHICEVDMACRSICEWMSPCLRHARDGDRMTASLSLAPSADSLQRVSSDLDDDSAAKDSLKASCDIKRAIAAALCRSEGQRSIHTVGCEMASGCGLEGVRLQGPCQLAEQGCHASRPFRILFVSIKPCRSSRWSECRRLILKACRRPDDGSNLSCMD